MSIVNQASRLWDSLQISEGSEQGVFYGEDSSMLTSLKRELPGHDRLKCLTNKDFWQFNDYKMW